ncbi:MAG: DoxX family protein [Elusimicrobia bacterium]|nr:DoxX family protein [Elusimicrobiota bacterium]
MDHDDILALAGRLLIAIIFLSSAFGKITDFSDTVKYMEVHGIPWSGLLCALAAAVEALGGISLILGFHVRWGAAVLAAFLIVATWIFHTGPEQRIHLLKNLAILGGLLQVLAFGPGALSLEGRRQQSS